MASPIAPAGGSQGTGQDWNADSTVRFLGRKPAESPAVTGVTP